MLSVKNNTSNNDIEDTNRMMGLKIWGHIALDEKRSGHKNLGTKSPWEEKPFD